MPIEYHFPVKLPRWTKKEFDEQRRQYVAKNGYEIHVPGWEEIIHWRVPHEPNKEELALYKKKDVAALGEKRYYQIQELMQKKRERFLRLLGSPTPRIAMNAASMLTFLDDINDATGTLAVACRITAHLLPRAAAKFLTGPAGWLLLVSDITNVAMELSRLPWKAKRLQHDYHGAASLNPLSKKAKLRRLNKLKRLKITKGEAIEALQTTDNLFGIGISLGPIMGLLYDIPFGMYRGIRGQKVTVTGLPGPLYYADNIAQRFFRGVAQLWYAGVDVDDPELGLSMVGQNFSTQWIKTVVGDDSPLDFIDDPSDIEIPVHGPAWPSTIDVIESEVGKIEDYTGWPATGKKWMSTNEMFDIHLDRIRENIKSWEERNKRDLESCVFMQNASDSATNSIALLEGDEAMELASDAVWGSYLKMFNSGYRLPLDTTREQLDCLTRHLAAYGAQGLEPSMHDIFTASSRSCGFLLTTEVPERATGTYADMVAKHETGIEKLKLYYFRRLWDIAGSFCGRYLGLTPDQIEALHKEADRMRQWLDYYGWPPGEPSLHFSLIINADLRDCFRMHVLA